MAKRDSVDDDLDDLDDDLYDTDDYDVPIRDSFDQDNYDDTDEPPISVDLATILSQLGQRELGKDEEGEGEEGSEDEDEEEYETFDEDEEQEEEEEHVEQEVFIDTPSQQEMRRQKERNKRILKAKKRDLIHEYLHDMKHFSRIRAKNTLLGLKIIARVGDRQAVVDKYVEKEILEQERLKEVERLKKLHFLESCLAFDPDTRGSKGGGAPGDKTTGPQGSKGPQPPSTAEDEDEMSSNSDEDEDTTLVVGPPTATGDKATKKSAPSGNTEEEVDDLDADSDMDDDDDEDEEKEGGGETDGGESNLEAGAEAKSRPSWDDNSALPLNASFIALSRNSAARVKPRTTLLVPKRGSRRTLERCKRKGVGFSFKRSKFFDEEKQVKRRNTDLMALRLSLFGIKDTRKKGKGEGSVDSSAAMAKKRSMTSLASQKLDLGGKRKKPFVISGEAKTVAKSRTRLGLHDDKLKSTVRHDVAQADKKNLNHFKFEFADPRLTAKQASQKLRGELLKLLAHRNIPSKHRKWPLEIKGVNFKDKNPYGRVILNYTKLSHHEIQHPHTAYRMLLTNVAYLRAKESKMTEVHSKNIAELEEEREQVELGLKRVIEETIEGLRIWTSVCAGSSKVERRKTRLATEELIEYIQSIFSRLVNVTLVDLYTKIQSTEFALRRLSISEGKGEGAELHEFKDIMRCREKLKAEHKALQNTILTYQRRSGEVRGFIRKTNKRMNLISDVVATMNERMKAVTKALVTMIEGMHFCQRLALRRLTKERDMKSEMGIFASDRMADDYENLLLKINESRTKRVNLQLQYNASIREIKKIGHMRLR